MSRPFRTIALIVALLSAPVAPGRAATKTVEMRDVSFSPNSLIVPLGSTLRWVNRGDLVHTTTKFNAFPAAWDRALQPGSEWRQTMPAAGAFSYYCRPHSDGVNGMRGTVRVPVAPSASQISRGSSVSLRLSTSKLGGPWVFDIDTKRGSGAWTRIRSGYAGSTFSHRPGTTGTYLYRATLRNTTTGKRSGTSPAARVIVS